jgi:Cof subfamily protein (haloacid dehalogenase superfamily)
MQEPDYRLILMDLDGTLLNEHSQVTARTRQALERAHNAGIDLAVATGRSYAMLRYFCGDLPLTGPQITFNGAIIVDPGSGEPLFRQALPPDLVVPVLEFLREHEMYTCFYTEQDIYVRTRAPLERALVPPVFPEPFVQPYLEELAHLPCYKLVAVAEPAAIGALRPIAEQAFGDVLYVTQTSQVLLEFLHPDVSKGAALKRIMHERGLRPEQVIAFGDSHNDLELLRAAGLGIAMGNASPEVQHNAAHVTCSNREDGIAVALDAFLWSRHAGVEPWPQMPCR